MQKKRHLWDEYRFPGFNPGQDVQGIFGDTGARVLVLRRRQKKQSVVPAGRSIGVFTTGRFAECGISPVGRGRFTWNWRSGVRSEEHTSELQSQFHLVCRLLLEQ